MACQFSHGPLTNQQFVSLLTQLDALLSGRDEVFKFYMLGGAAVSFMWGYRVTEDIDVVNGTIPDDIQEAIHQVAHNNNVNPLWLNNKSKMSLVRYAHLPDLPGKYLRHGGTGQNSPASDEKPMR